MVISFFQHSRSLKKCVSRSFGGGLLLGLFLCFSACSRHQEEGLVLVQIQDRNGISETVSVPERLRVYSEMDFLAAQPYKQVLRVYREGPQSFSFLTTYHPNGTIWKYLEAKEMRAHGAFREWFPNGKQRIEARVIGGIADFSEEAQRGWLFEGLSTVWDEEGRLVASIPYEQGALSGTSRYYYPSGQVRQEIPYSNDHMEGQACAFWEGGQIQQSEFYVRGEREGERVAFGPTGEILWREEYQKDLLLQGDYFLSAQGIVAGVREGEGFSALFEGEVLSELREIHGGKVDGLIKRFDRNGKLVSQYVCKEGKKQGEEILYYSGQQTPKLSIVWDADMIHGVVRTWYENRQLQSEREMVRNKREGSSLAWYRDGSLMLVEEYSNDLLEKGRYYRKKGRDPVSTVIGGNGVATLYDEEGALIHKVTYLKGRPVEQD